MTDFFDKGIIYGLGMYYTGIIIVALGAVEIVSRNNWDINTDMYFTPLTTLGAILIGLGALFMISVGVIDMLKRCDEKIEGEEKNEI